MYRYSWGSSQATLDSSTSPPCQPLHPVLDPSLVYKSAHQVVIALEGFPISWLMVAIECVWIMQLFCLKGSDMVNHNRFPHKRPQLMIC